MEQLKLENQLCFPLYAATRLVSKHYQPLLVELGITYPQYLVMLLLWEQDHRRITDLGECLLLETSTLTPLLKRLEQKGMVSRQRSKTDEREVIVSLTPMGQKAEQIAVTFPTRLIKSLQKGNVLESDMRKIKTVLDELIRFNRNLKRMP